MNFAIKHPNKHSTPPIIFILQSRSSKRGCFMQSWLHGGPPPCTEQPIGIKRGLAGKPRAQNRQQKQRNTRRTPPCTKQPIGIKRGLAGKPRAQNRQQKQRNTRRTTAVHKTANKKMGVNTASIILVGGLGYSWGIRGVFVEYSWDIRMYRVCVGNVSGMYREYIERYGEGKMRKNEIF